MSTPPLPLHLRPFPDVENVLMDLLDPRIAATVTATGAELVAPGLQVERVTGPPDDGITDYPRFAITAMGRTRPEAWQLAREVQAFLTAQVPGQVVITGPLTAGEWPGGVMFDSIRAAPPRQQPEQGRNARMVTTLYDGALRRPWW